MPGTGLPIPESGVLAQSPGVMDGDRISTASAWAQIARSGAQLAGAAFDAMEVQKAGYLADLENEARTKRIELQNANSFNPTGFQAAWKGYTDGKLGAIAPGLVDHMRKVYGGEGNSAYGSILADKTNQDRQLAGQSLTARLTSAQEDMLGLAASGRMGTPEFQHALQTYEGIGATMANGGFISPDEFEFDKRTLLGKATGETILANVDRAYAEKGYDAALAETDALLRDAKAGIPPAEQRSYFDKAKSRLSVREAERRDDLKEIRTLAEPTINLLRQGVDGLEGEAERLAKQFDAKGSPSDAARVRLAAAYGRGRQGAASLPTREWAAAGLIANPRVGQAIDHLVASELGLTREQAAGVVGNLLQESRLNPAARNRGDGNDGSDSIGIAQWNGDRARALQAYAQRTGGDASDIKTQLGFIVEELKTSEGGVLAALKAAKTPEEAAAAFISFERPQGWTADNPRGGHGWENRRRFAEVAAAPNGMDPGYLEGFRAEANVVFDDWLPKAKLQLGKFKLGEHDIGFMSGIFPLLDARRKREATEFLQAAEVSGAMFDVPPQQRAQLVGVLQQRAADGDPGAREYAMLGENQHQMLSEREKTDPLGRSREAGWIRLTPVNWGDGQEALTTALHARAREASVTAAQIGVPVVPALRDDDARALASALTTGPAERAMPVIAAMQGSLSPEQFAATMAMKPVQDALGVMARSGDVKRMTAAFSTYDALYRDNPAEFEVKFGVAVLDKLDTWQGKLQFYTEQQIADEMRRADDPARAAARQALKAEGEQIVKNVTPRDIAGKFGNWLSTPGLSPDALQNRTMTIEYQRLYAERFADTGDAAIAEKQALERLGNKWGVSAVNGGRLTPRPPERHYPAVRGSHDWMREELEAQMRAAGLLIPAPAQGPAAKPRGEGQMPNYALIADAETEADIAAGRPPSYVMWVADRNGQLKVPEDSNGKAMRFAWDREAAVESGRAWFERTFDFMGRVREGQRLDAEIRADQPRALPWGFP